MTLEKYKGHFVRPDTLDSYVVDEVQSSYKLLTITAKDTVLDVGANIGAFSKLACEAGAAKVVGYEPFPENVKIARKNAPKAEIHEAALIAGKLAVKVSFFVNVRGKNHGAHSSVPTRGRDVIEVDGSPFQKVLAAVKPTKIKMDCEGAEYDLLLEAPLPKCVKQIALEIHLQKKAHKEAAPRLHAYLQEQGFSVLKDPTPSFSTKAWHALGVYGRK